jgi:hypothetical protein
MSTQIFYHAVNSNPFEAVLPASNVDSSEAELEKILNEIGIFGDDYVRVHDQSQEEGTAIPVPVWSGGLLPLPSYDIYGISQAIAQVKPEAPTSFQDPQRMNSLIIGSSNPDKSLTTGGKRKSPPTSSEASPEKPQITEVDRR